MPCKSIAECIQYALSIGPVKEVPERLKNELQDFMAHECMKFSAHRSEAEQKLLIEFFNHVFRKEG